MIIGVDFDNTISDYDDLMRNLALEERWIDSTMRVGKQEIRDQVRSLEDGEIKWQKLQAKAYGTFMFKAKLIEGVAKFFASCHTRGIRTFIVSHKTPFAAQDDAQVNLHSAALNWMKENNFFQKDKGGLALKENQVFFEPNRQKKIERIIQLKCTHFIDDLEEIFKEKSFPQGVEKILFAPQLPLKMADDIKGFQSWEKIYEYFFSR